MREPRYGEIQSRANPEVYRIWMTRHQEPEPVVLECEESECDDASAEVDAKRIYGRLEECLRTRDMYVLHCYHVLDMTIAEIAGTLDLTPERVRQIKDQARRRAMVALSDIRSE